jgi:hypothetical protein
MIHRVWYWRVNPDTFEFHLIIGLPSLPSSDFHTKLDILFEIKSCFAECCVWWSFLKTPHIILGPDI